MRVLKILMFAVVIASVSGFDIEKTQICIHQKQKPLKNVRDG